MDIMVGVTGRKRFLVEKNRRNFKEDKFIKGYVFMTVSLYFIHGVHDMYDDA